MRKAFDLLLSPVLLNMQNMSQRDAAEIVRTVKSCSTIRCKLQLCGSHVCSVGRSLLAIPEIVA